MNRYNHEHDCPFEVLLKICTSDHAKWVKLPINGFKNLNTVLKGEIIDVDVYVDGLYDIVLQTKNISELNNLAKKISNMSDENYYSFCGRIYTEEITELLDVAKLIDSINQSFMPSS